MSLVPGTQLGPYGIAEAIGRGGMGEVYRARDARLNRDVAIKTSTQQFSERFEREAKAIAALNHPNICTLFDVGSAPDVPSYLVMELVEGPTLGDRIKEGPIAPAEAEAIALQIALALEAAHEKGITHRDLKPGNIKIRPDGSVKVLDFGLAKVGHTPTVEASENSPTLTSGMTEAGMILGTAAYMAPEQAKGRQVDHRADIWAFGVVLYEMLAGKSLFAGDDLTEVLASVVKDQPDLSVVPARFRKLLEACLQKDPRKRLASISDAKLLLSDDVASPPAAPQKSWLPWAVAAVLAIGLGLALWAPWRASSSPGQDVSVVLESAAQTAWLSPDGTRLLELGETTRVLTLSTGEYRELPGIQEMRAPFWSPDGRWIAFYYNYKLMVTPSSGGPVQEICQDTGDWFGGSWHPNGTVLVAAAGGPIRAVKIVNGAAAGGCEAVLPESGNSQWHPEWLPDGEHFLYTVPRAGVYFAKLQDTAPRRILPDVSSVRYAAPVTGEDVGHLLFLRGSRLMAQPFRAEDGSLQGDPVELATDVATEFTPFYGVVSIGSNGLLAYSTGVNSSQLTWLDRQGREIRKAGTPKAYAGLTLSPDDSTIGIAYPSGAGPSTTVRVSDGVETQFDVTRGLVWSPDGAWIAASKNQQGLVRLPAGGGPAEALLANKNAARPSQWTSNGILYTDAGDVWILRHPEMPGSQPEKVLGTPALETQAQLSPNGQWLAFTMIESGPMAVYVCHFPDCVDRQKLAGTREPRWSADGKELFWFRDVGEERELVAATVHPGATFAYDPPHVLFSLKADWFAPELNLYTYAPSRDGQRFLVTPFTEDATRRLHLVTSWRRLLKKPNGQ